MIKGGNTNIWAWGQSTYIRALQQEEKEKINSLKKRLESADTPELKAQIKAEIETTKADFKAKQRGAQRSFFSRG